MSLFARGSIRQGHERFSDESRERQEMYMSGIVKVASFQDNWLEKRKKIF